MLRLFLLIFLFTPYLLISQAQDKSIWFPDKKYSDHSRVTFPSIKSRHLPFSMSLSTFAPLPQNVPDSLTDQTWLLAYYSATMRKAFQARYFDRAYLTDSIAPLHLANYSPPEKAFRLFTSRNRQYDQIKYIRYTLNKGIPVLVGFAQKPESLQGANKTGESKGQKGPSSLLIIGYDSPTSSFQLLGSRSEQSGNQAYYWMTARELLAQATEILCLEDPTRTAKLEEIDQLGHPIHLQIAATIQQFKPIESQQTDLQAISAPFHPGHHLYQTQAVGSKDRFQIHLQIPKGRCTYLFVEHPDGSTTPAWMMEYNQQDTLLTLPPVSSYQFPDRGAYHFIILCSYQSIPRWRRYVDRYEFDKQNHDALKKVYSAFRDYLVPINKIQYEPRQILGKVDVSYANKENVLPLIIQWQVEQ